MDPSEFNASPLIPEYYTDSVNFATNLYGFTLEFGVMQAQDQPPRSVVRVRIVQPLMLMTSLEVPFTSSTNSSCVPSRTPS